jgi:hypothetical protein
MRSTSVLTIISKVLQRLRTLLHLGEIITRWHLADFSKLLNLMPVIFFYAVRVKLNFVEFHLGPASQRNSLTSF